MPVKCGSNPNQMRIKYAILNAHQMQIKPQSNGDLIRIWCAFERGIWFAFDLVVLARSVLLSSDPTESSRFRSSATVSRGSSPMPTSRESGEVLGSHRLFSFSSWTRYTINTQWKSHLSPLMFLLSKKRINAPFIRKTNVNAFTFCLRHVRPRRLHWHYLIVSKSTLV